MPWLSPFNHPCSFMVYYYLFGVFHLCKALFLGFLQFKGKFVDGQNTSKYRDRASLKYLTTSLFLSLCICLSVSSLTESQSLLALTTQPSSQTVQAGSPVTLKCSAKTNKKPITFEWKRNNNTIQTDKEPRFTIRDDGSLRISKTDLDDAGMYRCIASAKRGTKRGKIVRKSRFARLTVEGKILRLC